ncbi:hypothetical protein [uncultured Caulobacter sp.]|uniref:hypothetical protein n=1 Tax=uncultured Caulobacter sp. TaxID=158749 RepID=UPI0026086810|nr:hypothetical protein [uncultured Caulobacter sp.]
MARDELARAMTLTWRDLKGIVPWGDTFEGISPAGRYVEVERSYIWAAERDGDILCEVAVYGGPSRYDQGARASSIISRPV